jgi:hypothetical protein
MIKNEAGKWVKSTTAFEDYGYNIHAGKELTSYTLGCIRVEESTINRLTNLYDKVKETGGVMTLTVSESGNLDT